MLAHPVHLVLPKRKKVKETTILWFLLVMRGLERPRRGRRLQPNLNDFKVEVLDFEGKLDLNDFLE